MLGRQDNILHCCYCVPAVKLMKTGDNFFPDRSYPVLRNCVKLGGDTVVRRWRENTADDYTGFYLPAHSSECVSGCVYQIILALTFAVGKDYPFL